MSKLEEIREALGIMEKTVVVDFSKTQDDTKKAFKTVIDLARLILEEKELPGAKEVINKIASFPYGSNRLISPNYPEGQTMQDIAKQFLEGVSE